jgi:hypothetical protein
MVSLFLGFGRPRHKGVVPRVSLVHGGILGIDAGEASLTWGLELSSVVGAASLFRPVADPSRLVVVGVGGGCSRRYA